MPAVPTTEGILGGWGVFSAYRAEFMLIVINKKNNTNANAVRGLWLSHPFENVLLHHHFLGDPLGIYSLSCWRE
jgi:hypothetical protein